MMKNPPHPGRVVRRQCLDALGMSVTDGARHLGVSRKALSDVVNGHAGISPEMAIRLSKAFGSRPEVWAGMQFQYDLAQALKRADEIEVKQVPQPARNNADPVPA